MKLVLVALKCDLRETHSDDAEETEASAQGSEKTFIKYDDGLAVAKRIGALRYLGMYGRLLTKLLVDCL